MKMKSRWIWLAAVVGISAVVYAKGKWITVTYDGKPLTTKGAILNGQLYVPAADVAKGFSMNLNYPKGGSHASFEFAGSDPANSPQGKLNEFLFNGKTRMKLLGEGMVYTLEVRNAEKKPKSYHFGHEGQSQVSLFDGINTEVDAVLVDAKSNSSVELRSGSSYRVQWQA